MRSYVTLGLSSRLKTVGFCSGLMVALSYSEITALRRDDRWTDYTILHRMVTYTMQATVAK